MVHLNRAQGPQLQKRPGRDTRLTALQNPSDPDCWWTWQGCTTPDPSLGIPADLYDLPTPNTLALTIDDGPNCSQNAFYEFLREQNQKMSV